MGSEPHFALVFSLSLSLSVSLARSLALCTGYQQLTIRVRIDVRDIHSYTHTRTLVGFTAVVTIYSRHLSRALYVL